MKKEDMFDANGEVDERKAADARNVVSHKRKTIWVKWSAIAACLCLMISGIWVVRQSDERGTLSQAMAQTVSSFDCAAQETKQRRNNMFTDNFFPMS